MSHSFNNVHWASVLGTTQDAGDKKILGHGPFSHEINGGERNASSNNRVIPLKMCPESQVRSPREVAQRPA